MLADCGLAQIFDFAVDGEKIWFTEWVENNIGVVDTSVSLPVEIQLESEIISLSSGDSKHFNFVVSPKSNDTLGGSLILISSHDFLRVELSHDSPDSFQLVSVHLNQFIQTFWHLMTQFLEHTMF